MVMSCVEVQSIVACKSQIVIVLLRQIYHLHASTQPTRLSRCLSTPPIALKQEVFHPRFPSIFHFKLICTLILLMLIQSTQILLVQVC